jgi:hypothetical protein
MTSKIKKGHLEEFIAKFDRFEDVRMQKTKARASAADQVVQVFDPNQ